MSDAIGFVISLFRSFISTVFGYFNFTYNGYSANIGWLSISALIFGILISSLLNLPSRFEAKEVGAYIGSRRSKD